MPNHRFAAVWAGAALALAVLPAFGADATLALSGMTAPAPPPGIGTMAIYGRLTNTGDAPLVLAGVEAAGFAQAMLHETVTTDGVVTMRHVMSLTIQPGETIDLAPGHVHIMLVGATEAVTPGDTVSGVFRFEGGATITFEAGVTGPAGMDMHKAHGTGHKADGAS